MPRGRLVPTQRGRAHRPPRLSPPPPGNARPRPPRGVPGWRPHAGSGAASRGACRCPPPKLQPPGTGTPVPQSPAACASLGMQTTAIRSPSALPFSSPAPAPGRGPAAFPALPPPRLAPSSRWVAWPPARSPAPGMGRAMARNWAAPGHGANLLPGPAVLPGAGARRSARSHSCPSLLAQAVWVPQGWGAGKDGERVLLCVSAPGTDAVDTQAPSPDRAVRPWG